MTLESVPITESSAARGFCSCCGAKIMPYFTDNSVASQNQINQLTTVSPAEKISKHAFSS